MPSVNYDQFDHTKFRFEKARKVESNASTFYVIPCKYNYGTDESPRWEKFRLQGPELDSAGIKEKESWGRLEYKVTFKLPNGNDKIEHFKSVVEFVYRAAVQAVGENRNMVGKRTFDPNNQGVVDTMFSCPIFVCSDMETREPQPERGHLLTTKFGTGYKDGVLLLPNPDLLLHEQIVPFKDHLGKKLSCYPLFEISDIFINTNWIRLRMPVVSAVLTDLGEADTASLQKDMVEEYAQNNKEAVDALTAKLERMRVAKASEPSTPEPSTPAGEASTPAPSNPQPQNPSPPTSSFAPPAQPGVGHPSPQSVPPPAQPSSGSLQAFLKQAGGPPAGYGSTMNPIHT